MGGDGQFKNKWVLTCPEGMEKVFDDIPRFSKKYLADVRKAPGLVIKNEAFFTGDYDGRYVKVKNGERLTTGQPETFEETVYLLGASYLYGAYCENNGTIASHLQTICNQIYPNRYIFKNYGTRGATLEFYGPQLPGLPLKRGDTVFLISSLLVSPGHDVTPYEFIMDLYLKCQELGVNFCFFLYPRLPELIGPSLQELIRLNNRFETLYNNGLLKTKGFKSPAKYTLPPILAQLNMAGCPCFDLQPAINRPHDKGEIFIDKGHLSSKGYQLLARSIFDNYIINAPLKQVHRKQVGSASYQVFADTIRAQFGAEENIAAWLKQVKEKTPADWRGCRLGAIVMNCNPFTNGHLYLIESALKQIDFLYLFIVAEDRSEFSLATRFKLVEDGTTHLHDRIRVLSSGQFIISSFTFPEYFAKTDLTLAAVDSSNDVAIFGAIIARELQITTRFIGEEPYCNVTRQYNETMKRLLPPLGVEVVEIKRIESNGQAISASNVRRYAQNKNWAELNKIVPESTLKYLMSCHANVDMNI